MLASRQAPSRLALAQLWAVHRHPVRAWVTLDEAGGLAALRTIHQAPGKVSRLTVPMREQLHARLHEPRGVASYPEIWQYVADTHALALSYRAVPAWVR